MLALPATPSAVTPRWLNSALRLSLLDLPTVDSIDLELIGQGFGLTGVVARLHLRYERQSRAAPASLILKLPMAMPESASHYREAQSVDDEPSLHYFARCAREVDFYRTIAPQIPNVAAHAYYAAADKSERVVVILLEDLAGARSGDVLAGCSGADAHAVLEQIDRVHAQWWDRAEFSWVPRWSGDRDAQQERLARQIPPFLDRWGSTIPVELRSIVECLSSCYASLLKELDRRPPTIIHADLHLDNVLFDVPGRTEPVILDWQSVCLGPAIVDVGLFIAGSLTPHDRRQNERDLLGAYHARLVAGGVTNYPFDQLQHDYWLSLARMLAGIVGWLANTDLDRLHGRERQLVEAALGDGRLTAALLDHDILGLLRDL